MKLSKMKRRLTGFSMFAVMSVSLFSAGADVLTVKAAEAEETVTTTEVATEAVTTEEMEVAEESRVEAGAEVAINEMNFPDSTFREYVKQFDTDGNGSLSSTELSAVTEIDVSGSYSKLGNIASLKGIEYFTALTDLSCGCNQLTDLDVSKNAALTDLSCFKNELTSLDVSNNTALTMLACSQNNLTGLDVSNNTALTILLCSLNQLTSLDVSKNTALRSLDCFGNQLTSLDVSNNTALTDLICLQNKLTSLDVSKNTVLDYLDCYNNELTSLDVSKNTALDYLDCGCNELTSLDVSKNTALDLLKCENNRIKSRTLDVSKNMKLTSLTCDSDALTSMDACKDIEQICLHLPLYKKENSYYFDLSESSLDKTRISKQEVGTYDSASGHLTVPESYAIRNQISYNFGSGEKQIDLKMSKLINFDSYAEYQGYSFFEDENGDKYCLDSNGNKVINDFKCDGTYTYYFQADGTAMRDRLTYHPDGVNVIYFDEEGHEVFSNFHEVKKSIEGNVVNDLCFFDVYGHMYVDVMTYGNAAFGNGDKIYYINPYGVIERNGWFGFSETCVWAGTDKKVGTGIGYANADGSLMINQNTYYNGNLVYMQGDGHIQ